MAHQQSISEFLILLYQERILIADLYEKKEHRRLYGKSELLKLCRENTERFDRLLQWEVLKPRSGKFELNQSLLEAFSVLLRLPTSSPRFSQAIEEFKSHVRLTQKGSGNRGRLTDRKNLIRNVEESLLQALENAAIDPELAKIEHLTHEMRELRSYLWEEKGLQIYRDVEMDSLIQDLGQLLQEGLISLENIQQGLANGKSATHLLKTKMMKLTALRRTGNLREQTNLEMILENKPSVLLEQVETFRPRIASQQLKDKSSLNMLSKFNKKGKKR